ncbi:MAG: murein biosynthesis integral membrane protein MurJ [Oligoflexia bacterium]|nr:murein biosynthesis integral membrane protein MurJ [Oligoflexia bacterium]
MTDLYKQKHHVTKSAFWVGLGTLTSRGLGFLREIVIAHYFSRLETDVFFVAFRLPNLFRRLFGEGALTVSFIPVLTDFLKSDDKKGARDLISGVFTLLFLVLSILTLLGTLYPEVMVTPLTSGEGFTQIAGKVDLTVHQARIMFCYILLVSFYAFFMGILNSLQIFWLPAVAPAFWNLAVILSILFFRNYFEIKSDVLAWATILGGVLQLVVLIPNLLKSQLFPKFSAFWKNRATWRVVKAMGPSVLGLSVMQVGVIINTYFASQLEQGSNSWIFWADRILELPLSLFAVSVGTAVLPTLAAQWSKGEKEQMRQTSLHSLKLTFLMAFPCAFGVYFLSYPIIQTLFEHGQFQNYDTLMTSSILQIYGFGIIFAAGVRVIAPTYYAMKNTWLPALSAATALIIHVFIAQLFMQKWGVRGLAASSVLSGGINFLILIFSYRLTGASLKIYELVPFFIKVIIACIALSFTASFTYSLTDKFIVSVIQSRAAQSINLIFTIMLAAFVYFAVCRALKLEEITEISSKVFNKLKAKRNK